MSSPIRIQRPSFETQSDATSDSYIIEDEPPIVLSELVRTAEASRLRRRGNLGVSASSLNSNPSEHNGRVIPDLRWNFEPFLARSGSWSDGSTQPPSIWETIAIPEDATKSDEDMDGSREVSYELYCGVEEPCFQDEEDEQKFEVSPLPSYPPQLTTKDASSNQSRGQCFRRRTGCGALIHVKGSPRTRTGTWQARGKATNEVIFMHAKYFDRGGQMKKFTCGCRYFGVGCSQCGNVLGNITVPCQVSASSSTSATRASRTASSTISSCYYTFFNTSVTSSPPFTFPEASSHALPLGIPPPLRLANIDVDEVSDSGSTGPFSTSGSITRSYSPSTLRDSQPYSALGRSMDTPFEFGYESSQYNSFDCETEGPLELTGFDSDGVLLGGSGEPSSPDKAAGSLLLPER